MAGALTDHAEGEEKVQTTNWRNVRRRKPKWYA